YSRDGGSTNVNGGWGLPLLNGSLTLAAEYLDRQPTNRAYADSLDISGTGLNDHVGPDGKVVVKRNAVPQPNYHWGDGLERDVLTMGNLRLPLTDAGTSELYAFGGYSFRRGNGEGYRRYATGSRSWPEI